MDAYEATRVVFSRIQSLDPQNASKIMGLLLIQDNPHNQMIRLAFGPLNLLHSLVLKARQHLSTLNPWLGVGSSFLDDPANSGSGWKPCLYYAKGFCKNGPTCNFVHRTSPSGAANLKRGARFDNGRGDLNQASRQIYLTFPAESTFREEDVSNYFSIYGAVEDVRIPYQQKRMFGFVTFVYSETVKFILAKGNPHFVCDSRVLVKPYKDKPKIPDNFRKQQQMERGELSACNSLNALDSQDPFDLQFGGRNIGYESEHMLWRKKLAEEQAELHHALELQSRRLMDLQLLDVKRNHHHHRSMSTGAPIPSPTHSPNSFFHQPLLGSDPSSPDASDENSASPPLNNAMQAFQEAFNVVTDNYNNLLESLDLPDSPFASPTKRTSKFVTNFTNGSEMENTSASA